MAGEYDPTSGMSPLELLLAGIGQGMNNTKSGIQQSLGQLSKQDIRDLRDLDSSLLSTGMGRAGSVLGSTLSMVPVAFAPGANTLAGAGLLGTGMGPSCSPAGPPMRRCATLRCLGSLALAASSPGALLADCFRCRAKPPLTSLAISNSPSAANGTRK